MFNFLITLESVLYNISDILNSTGLVFNKEKMHKCIDLYRRDLVLKYLVVIYAPYKLT